ncbi:MEKHLA domain-containing protein [Mastigocladopsis repens]|uniref:MEKHLA domain-containing protein n=1 Tax=Mastigocladopsis repens TaxID=221287 RepID=UPI00031A8B6C|nr:MEKHLA domain-containing protein [Mastigocladopsis repens]
MDSETQLPWQQETVICHSQRLMQSFQYWTGFSLLDASGSPEEIAQGLFDAPFVLASHGTEPDPILNYGNRRALQLWELSWEEFTQTPSRQTAQEVVQEERNRLLSDTATKGFSNFSGVRITSTGKRFEIQDGILWNVIGEDNQLFGQAAVCSKCKFLT